MQTGTSYFISSLISNFRLSQHKVSSIRFQAYDFKHNTKFKIKLRFLRIQLLISKSEHTLTSPISIVAEHEQAFPTLFDFLLHANIQSRRFQPGQTLVSQATPFAEKKGLVTLQPPRCHHGRNLL